MLKNFTGSGFKEFRETIIEILIIAGDMLKSGKSFTFTISINLNPIQLIDPNQEKGWKYERKK